MKLRIAHVTATFPPYRGGTGNVCLQNARELARRGHEFHVYTAAIAGAPAEEARDGFFVHRLNPLLQVGNAPVLPQLLRSLHGFDVIHLHYPFFGGEITALAAKLARAPLLITYHQDVLLGGTLGVVAKALEMTAGRLALRAAARLLFTSYDYGQASRVRSLLRAEQIGELSNGVDLERFSPSAPQIDVRARHQIGRSSRIVLLVAALDRAHYFKGVDIFLGALAQLPPDIIAVIVGDGDMLPSYRAEANRLGISARICFAGRASDQELPDYYRSADLTVLPSITMGEAFGLVLLESLACGTPVVASDLPGVRTVVADQLDGLLVPPSDTAALASAIKQILSDEQLRRAMGLRGRAKAEARYDWRLIGERLEAIYLEVLRAAAPRSIHARGEP
jgi:glycosyltransferase involved in cell wall biosynthesis